MDGLSDASVTMRQGLEEEGPRDTLPVLLLVGAAQLGGAIDTPRVIRLPKTLEIGRVRLEVPGADPGADESRGVFMGLADRLLSRAHLRVQRVAGGVDVEDAGSLNGTFIDGRRLAGRERLTDGNLLLFGGHAAVFRRVSENALAAIDEELAAPFGPVATISPSLATTLWRLRRLARSGSEILITGETGSGKEVYARAFHQASGRRGRLVAINCAAIPSELAESELFGYARGAHSTANEAKAGLISAADGGTLFLDEIGDMNPRLQAKLLRFLQDRELTPLGSTTSKKVDVQVIAATHSVGPEGLLRADLAARLGSQAIRLPPLRERVEDLGALVHHFLTKGGTRQAPELEPTAFHALCHYAWPRNVRELQKVIEESIAVSEGAPRLKLSHLPDVVSSVMEASGNKAPDAAPPRKRAAPTKTELEDLLRQHEGNVAQVARVLDRQWAVVWRWIVKLGIDPVRYRK
ncbi:MAG TPA: sigma 54-interacting transcriptional regulator [Polyangia bacterium]|nr:sigma 54-interacting transcriptional regulator [Polyangia bacterium]